MPRFRIPASLRKFVRKEKARIRREVFDDREAEEQIKKIIAKFHVHSRGNAIK